MSTNNSINVETIYDYYRNIKQLKKKKFDHVHVLIETNINFGHLKLINNKNIEYALIRGVIDSNYENQAILTINFLEPVDDRDIVDIRTVIIEFVNLLAIEFSLEKEIHYIKVIKDINFSEFQQYFNSLQIKTKYLESLENISSLDRMAYQNLKYGLNTFTIGLEISQKNLDSGLVFLISALEQIALTFLPIKKHPNDRYPDNRGSFINFILEFIKPRFQSKPIGILKEIIDSLYILRNLILHQGKVYYLDPKGVIFQNTEKNLENPSKNIILPSPLWIIHRIQEIIQNFISQVAKNPSVIDFSILRAEVNQFAEFFVVNEDDKISGLLKQKPLDIEKLNQLITKRLKNEFDHQYIDYLEENNLLNKDEIKWEN